MHVQVREGEHVCICMLCICTEHVKLQDTWLCFLVVRGSLEPGWENGQEFETSDKWWKDGNRNISSVKLIIFLLKIYIYLIACKDKKENMWLEKEGWIEGVCKSWKNADITQRVLQAQHTEHRKRILEIIGNTIFSSSNVQSRLQLQSSKHERKYGFSLWRLCVLWMSICGVDLVCSVFQIDLLWICIRWMAMQHIQDVDRGLRLANSFYEFTVVKIISTGNLCGVNKRMWHNPKPHWSNLMFVNRCVRDWGAQHKWWSQPH